MQLLLLLEVSSLMCSSSSSSISGVIAFIVRLFFVFLFDTLFSTSSTSSRISFLLKTNFPIIAIRFPFLRSLRTLKSSLASLTSFYKRAISADVLLSAAPDRSIYRFIGVSRVEERTILLTSDVACRNSVPSGSELSSRKWSRSFGVVIGGRVVGGVEEGFQRVERIVIGLRG
jgi:hypothetical protein